MADRLGGNSIPWGSLAVVAAFVSSTLLVQHAFQPLRPSEKGSALPQVGAELEVEARLWEDPFMASRRFESERIARCDKLAASQRNLPAPPGGLTPEATDRPKDCDTAHLVRRRDPASLISNLDHQGDHDLADALVMLVMVPGNAFVGAEEGRRRTRYAVLAGLQAQGYVPDDAEHFGLLEARRLLPVSAHTEPWMLRLPYEMLSQRPALRGAAANAVGAGSYKRVAVLWVDETALPQPKLDAMAAVLGTLMKRPAGWPDMLQRSSGPVVNLPHLALIGPSSSDGLRTALVDLQRTADRCQPPAGSAPDTPRCAAMPEVVRQGYVQLARAQLFNATATAPLAALPIPQQAPKLDTGAFVSQQLARINGLPAGSVVDYRSTIASDDAVLGSLVTELKLRLPKRDKQRVVLVAERDSLYAQSLVAELQFRLQGTPGDASRGELIFEPHYFFRGLDGATTLDAGTDKPTSGKDKDSSSGPPVEWPEARDQLDYLRRLAIELKASEASTSKKDGPIAAIGILANDVHDKLLVMQALHDSFPDKVFFTTDQDARYVHPRTLGYTRNLVVASSLPLAFADIDIQQGTPPFRDVYQTSLFLAAQLAGCRREQDCKALREGSDAALKSPSVYEIGRRQAVPVAGYDYGARVLDQHWARTGTALPIWLLLAGALLVWPTVPALRAMRAWLQGTPLPPPGGVGRAPWLATATLAVMHLAVLAFALGTTIEFCTPGRLGLSGILLLTAGVAGGAVLLFALRRWLRFGPQRGKWRAPPWLARGITGLLIGAAAVWVAWVPASNAPCTDCEPAAWLEGVSAWPSQMLHLLALVALVCILDLQWNRVRDRFERDTRWLALPVGGAVASSVFRPGWLRRHTMSGWRRSASQTDTDTIEVATLWGETAQRAETSARMLRTLTAYVVTLGVMVLLFTSLSANQVPEVPVRGLDHRALVRLTLYLVLLLLPLLMVAVADATLLTHRFIGHLDRARSQYPDDTLKRFANALGSVEVADQWQRKFAALPWRRADPQAPKDHTLLDNWIDVRLIGRRTAAVGPLIVGPLVIVALLVVARSRLLDNWAITLPVALAICAYLSWLVVLALLLKSAAERARDKALRLMQADLLWLMGTGDYGRALVEPFKRLIDEVRNSQHGAFAPLFEQPLFRGLMVPLGGIGSTQLFDYFLLAH